MPVGRREGHGHSPKVITAERRERRAELRGSPRLFDRSIDRPADRDTF